MTELVRLAIHLTMAALTAIGPDCGLDAETARIALAALILFAGMHR